MNHVENNEWLTIASTLRKRGFNDDEISVQLRETGTPENVLQEVAEHLKQLRFTQKRKTGFTCCGIGVMLLVAGCVLALLLYNNGADTRFALYGITIIGLAFTFKGLIDIIGW